MSIISGNNNSDGSNFAIGPLPKTAIQAIYHAVTGKTENLFKSITGKVIIRSANIDNLYDILIDQLNLYPVVAGPTTTIVVKSEGGKSTTYSSWERYKSLRVNNHEITSDITLKLEFIIQLPNTETHQRCIVTINMDSALEVISDIEHRKQMEFIPAFFFINKEWNTVTISIDFVDFLVAKSFIALVEEWFQTLDKTPYKPLNNIILHNIELIRTSLMQCGRLGMAIFMLSYAFFNRNSSIDMYGIIVAGSIGLAIWAVFVIIESSIFRTISRRTIANVIPSIILITDGDTKAYQKILDSLTSANRTAFGYLMTIIGSVILNILSSYIYTQIGP